MAKIFISYSRSDSNIVNKIIASLNTAGHQVWVDRVGIRGGEKWRQRIVNAIEESDIMVLVLSKNSVTSENVRKELDLAEGHKIRVIPVVIQPIEIPSTMKYQLAGIQQIDLYSRFETGLQELLDAISGEHGGETLASSVRKRKPSPFAGRQPSTMIYLVSLAGIVLGALLAFSLLLRSIIIPMPLATSTAQANSTPTQLVTQTPTPTLTITPTAIAPPLATPTITLLLYSPRTYHLGDEDLEGWETLYGDCFDGDFKVDISPIQSLTLELETFGADAPNLISINDSEVAPLPPQTVRQGERFANYWSDSRSVSIPTDEVVIGANRLTICSAPAVNPDFQGDQDDFQIRNIRLTAQY